MTKNDALAQARQEHARLGDEIAAHDRAYYQDDAPKISDAEYDALRRRYVRRWKRQFPELADDKSLSRKVGAAPAEKFAKIAHAVPMLSLGNVFADEEVSEFVARVRRFLGLAAEAAARLYRRAEDRRPVLLAALREGRAGQRRPRAATASSARTSPPMSRTIADIPQRLARRAAGCARRARRGLYEPRRFRRAERSGRRRRASRLRQSAQRRGGLAAPARSRRSPPHGRCAFSPMPGARSATLPADNADAA